MVIVLQGILIDQAHESGDHLTAFPVVGTKCVLPMASFILGFKACSEGIGKELVQHQVPRVRQAWRGK